jgi:para-nitrobenzyl esterase
MRINTSRMRRGQLPGAGRRFAFASAAFVAVAAAGQTAQAADPVAQTEYGRVVGSEQSEVRRFLGIRYAAAPVGDLRWRPPQAPEAQAGDIPAKQFADHCPQNGGAFGLASTTEDCLFLNVYSPARTASGISGARQRPVMVYIHGGSLVTGESDDYDPTRMVAQGDVVVVTINYRLGGLGFLAQPALDAEGHPSANYGILDQQAALGWVRRNIAGFGGNPLNVTIFGESAGGVSVLSHLASPGSAGLFQRAIVQSGSYGFGYTLHYPTLTEAQVQGNAFAARLGCTGDPAAAETAACLRQAPVERILATNSAAPSGPVTIADGTVLPQPLNTAFRTGAFNQVPVVNGTTHDEYRLFVATGFDLTAGGPLTAERYAGAVNATFGANAPAVLAAYPVGNYPSPDLAFAAVATDAVFACPGLALSNWLSQYVPTWHYEFNDPNAPEPYLPPVSFPYASAHASELQYLFDIIRRPGTPDLTQDQLSLAGGMVQHWTRFATTGRPGGGPAPAWPRYRQNGERFQTLAPPEPATTTGFSADHKCDLWFPILPTLR